MTNIIDAESNEIVSGATYLNELLKKVNHSKTNLLVQTINVMLEVGKTAEDIIFIGSLKSGHRCEWQEFVNIANIEYDKGFGREEIATDLEIVFRDCGRMKRGNYDGSEWWYYEPPLSIPSTFNPIETLRIESFGDGLADVNKEALDVRDLRSEGLVCGSAIMLQDGTTTIL